MALALTGVAPIYLCVCVCQYSPGRLDLAPEAECFIDVQLALAGQRGEYVLLQADGGRSVPAVGRLLTGSGRRHTVKTRHGTAGLRRSQQNTPLLLLRSLQKNVRERVERARSTNSRYLGFPRQQGQTKRQLG